MKDRMIRVYLLLIIAVIIGCSGNEGNILTLIEPPATPSVGEESNSDRLLWGIWNITFDPFEGRVVIEPVRNIEAHFDVTEMVIPPACDDCFEVNVNSFDPVTRILDADVTLRNPYPLSGYDVRGILFTNDYGHELRNADDWTKLFEQPGGQSLNPFKAFAKGETNRKFAADTEHTENYRIYIPLPPNYWAITYAVTASWPGNCREPYAIEDFEQYQTLYNYVGAQANVLVFVRDWQGDVDEVTLVAPEITGQSFTAFYYDGADIWRLTLINNEGAPAGEYEARIIAASENSGDTALYDYVTITVDDTDGPVVTGINPNNAEIGEDITDATITGDNFLGPCEVKLFKLLANEIHGTNVIVVNSNTITCDFSIPLDQVAGLYNVVVTNADDKAGAGIEMFEVICPVPTVTAIFPDNGYAGINLPGVEIVGNDFHGTTAEIRLKKTGEPDIIAANVIVDSLVLLHCDLIIPHDAAIGMYDVEVTNGCGSAGAGTEIFEITTKDGWAQTWGGDGKDVGYSVDLDSDGNIYVGGYINGDDAFLRKFKPDGTLEWDRQWAGTEVWAYVYVTGVFVNEWDYVYYTGYFAGTVDFDPDPVDEVVYTTGGNSDPYIASFYPNGDLRFAYCWGGPGSDGAYGITGRNNNIYVTGYFRDTADFCPGPFTDEHTAVAEHDAFLSKFDGYGDYQWAVTWGGSCGSYYQDAGKDAAVNSDGDVLVVGHFMGSPDFDPGAGSKVINSNGSGDAFITWFRADGTFVTAGGWGGSEYDIAAGITIDASDNVYVTGSFKDFADFNPFAGWDHKMSKGGYDAYLVKLHTQTTFMAYDGVSTWGGTEGDGGSGVGVYDGGIYVTGSFCDTVDFDPGAGTDERTSNGWKNDIYLSRFNAYDDFGWVIAWGSDEKDAGLSVAADASGNVFLTGYFCGTIDFDPGFGIDEHASNGSEDAFLCKFPPDGMW